MKNLEKYIIDNRDKFDLEEPNPEHFEKFLGKNEKYRKSTDNFSWVYLLQVAAITILFVLSSLWIYEKFFDDAKDQPFITLSDISQEYMEAEVYYTSLINRKYNEIKSFEFEDNSLEQDILLKELSEMDSIYLSLEKELNVERGNHMVISAMIRHYQLKLHIMSQIIEHLYQIRTEEKIKKEKDENIRI